MAFNRPSLTTLIARVKSDLAAIPGTSPRLRYTVEGVLAAAMAGLAHGLYGYIDKAVDQMFPDTADSEYMRRWAALYNVLPIAATAAKSPTVTITGTNGSVCPAGTLWKRADGVAYSQDASVTIASGVATISVTSTTTGLATNADALTSLTIASPVTGIAAAATMTAAATGGTDDESDDALLARLRQRLASPPLGGGAGNYITWALEVPGVTRAWEYPLLHGSGTVGVTFVRDNDGVGAAIIPSTGEVADVAAHIAAVAPIDATVDVFMPTAYAVNFQISPNPSTTDTQNAITAELSDYLLRAGSPGATLPLSQISEAISQAAGVVSHHLILPSSDVVVPAGNVPILGLVVWS